MHICDLGHGGIMFGGIEEQTDWFQSKGLLAKTNVCPACDQQLECCNLNGSV